MPIRLNGTTSGYTELSAPATAGSNTLTLPTGNGTNGQYLQTNGSGVLSWATVAGSQWTTSGSDINYTTGKVLVGTSSSYASYGGNGVQIENSGGPELSLKRATSSDGSTLGFLTYYSTHGLAGTISCVTDGAQTASSTPGYLRFMTTPSGSASSPTERMRVWSDGSITIRSNDKDLWSATSTYGIALNAYNAADLQVAADARTVAIFNRCNNDGTVVQIRQAGVSEGDISVSGTTVSYNGAHLSRWSQLPGGATREEILRGTVLSNIDEMCNWGEEENEQLNRMKVSDVEGDPNVSGVFQAWDDDDDTYTDDFYCAMTGDFIIRIAEGVTVQRGDLLMSAGDGTAKPQDDDIVRSKTVAKVTSTHVTCTYEDGSYCVPCVLMAC